MDIRAPYPPPPTPLRVPMSKGLLHLNELKRPYLVRCVGSDSSEEDIVVS